MADGRPIRWALRHPLAIAVVYTPLFFRVVRGSVLAESAQTYVVAASMKRSIRSEAG